LFEGLNIYSFRHLDTTCILPTGAPQADDFTANKPTSKPAKLSTQLCLQTKISLESHSDATKNFFSESLATLHA